MARGAACDAIATLRRSLIGARGNKITAQQRKRFTALWRNRSCPPFVSRLSEEFRIFCSGSRPLPFLTLPLPEWGEGTYCGPQAGTSLSFAGSIGLLLTSETEMETPLFSSTACCKRGMISLKTE